MNRRAAGEPQAGLARHTTMVCSSARMAGCRSRQIAEIGLSGAAGTVATPNGSAASGDAPINNMVSTPMRDTFPMEGSDTSASRVSSRPFDQKDSEIRRSRKSEHQHYSLRAAAFGLRFGVKPPSDPKSDDPKTGLPKYPGGLNRSTQHFILKERWSVV